MMRNVFAVLQGFLFAFLGLAVMPILLVQMIISELF